MVLTLGAFTIIVDQAWVAAWTPPILLLVGIVAALALKDWWTAGRRGRPPT